LLDANVLRQTRLEHRRAHPLGAQQHFIALQRETPVFLERFHVGDRRLQFLRGNDETIFRSVQGEHAAIDQVLEHRPTQLLGFEQGTGGRTACGGTQPVLLVAQGLLELDGADR